jgi:hypothetical protein
MCVRAMYPHSENAMVTTLAGAPGIASFNDAVGSRARFNEPNAVLHVKLARHSLCLVADGNNNRVRAIDLETMRVSTIAGASASGYSDGNGRHGGAAAFHYPSALATSQDSSSPSSPFVVVWVADMYNSVVRRLEVREEEAVVVEGESIATGAARGSELKVTCVVTTLRLVHALSRAPVPLCVCVCVCVCVCIRMYVYTHVYRYICFYVYMHLCVSMCV